MSITITNRQGKQLFVQVNGLDHDHAPVIVFSNSLGTDKGMWTAQIAALQDRFKIITYDTRGHGQSDVIENTSLKNLGEDVIDLLDALNIQHAHFCGISMGGLTALWLGLHYPQRFDSITVANSAAKIWTEEGWNSRADVVAQTGLSEIVASTHSRWFSEQFDYAQHALAVQTIQSLAATPAQGYANACRALASADLRENIAEISIPTLIVAGAVDPVTTVADGQFMQQKITASQLVVIQASHLSNIEQAEDFTQALSDFIESTQ